jgi:hypothetical protein
MTEKKYIWGSAKAITTQYWEMLNLSLKLSDMQAIVNEKGYVNMTVMKKKEVWQYGDTHYVVENNYKPSVVDQAKKIFGKEFGESRVDVSEVPF